MASLRRALPADEWRAVGAWLSTFYPFQLEWLLDWSRFALCVKSRQIGASHSYAAASVLWGLLGETTTVISVGEREASEVVDKARMHAEALTRLGSRWAKPVGRSTEIVTTTSGGRVIALPSTSGGRSYSGNVVLDEFAYHQHPEKVWDGAGGTVMHGYKLRVLSTPNGVGNLFHNLWTSEKAHKGYTLHRVTLDDARAQGLRVDEAECWKMARGDPRVFDQLFRCSFLDNEQQYIPSALIDAATVDEAAPLEGETFAGLDVGRTANLTALAIVREFDGVLWELVVEVKRRTSNEDLDELVGMALGTFGVRRLCVDATGMGAFPAEALQKKYGSSRVEAVTFTPAVKEDLATGLFQRFVDRRIRLRRDSVEMRDDIRALRRIVTTAGNVRYDAPETADGHADRAWALALANHAATRPDNRRHEIFDHYETDDE